MPATNQRLNRAQGTPQVRKRARAVKRGMSGVGHTTSAKTNRRMFTTQGNKQKKGDYGRQTSLYMSSGQGPFMQTKRGDGFPKRARGKHRLRPKQGHGAALVR